MPLSPPNLDDRNFSQLLAEAQTVIARSCPEWTDRSPGDPGIVLLELFAHLTEVMIHRLNRLPEKAYVEFLRLIGVTLHPPTAASVALRFSASRAPDHPLEIPKGTRVAVGRSAGGAEPAVFVTSKAAMIDPGSTETDVLAHHCELVEAELAGFGTSLPRLSVAARKAPIVAPTRDGLDLIVGVEAIAGELAERAPARKHEGKTYRIWKEVEDFTELGVDRFVYVADRMTGTITFAPEVKLRDTEGELNLAPASLAEIPQAGREIRLWYRCGGGREGNVAANTLTTLKDTIAGVQVTNPTPATGGRAAETLENALLRGPHELHSLRRAVTASDFELVAERSGAVARAKAFTKARLWTHAAPGTVEVLLVPFVPEEALAGGQATAEMLRQHQTEEARVRIQKALDQRRPLGTTCLVDWVRHKTISVCARVVVHRGEDAVAVQRRVLDRLYQTINPLPTKIHPSGWRFGQPLRASNLYDIILSEPGVSYADRVRLVVDEVPGKSVSSLAADAFQGRTWYAGSGDAVFRSINDGDGWELISRFAGEEVDSVSVHRGVAGIVAVSTRLGDQKKGSRIYMSADCGESWTSTAQTAFTVEDISWISREGVPVLLVATDVGLYELPLRQGASPVQVLVDPQNQDLGFYAVATSTDFRGGVSVAVAARATDGVYLSSQAGQPGTFTHIGLKGEDVRVLAVQYDGPRSFLWAGVAVVGNEPGKGGFSWELRGSAAPPEGWRQFQRGWVGGSCRSLAFQGTKVLAATHHAGVVWLDSNSRDAGWQGPAVGCGLPIRDVELIFQPVNAVAVDGENRLILAGGPAGVFRSNDGGSQYENCSTREFSEKVTLPETWLFCSGQHEVDVVSEDEAERD